MEPISVPLDHLGLIGQFHYMALDQADNGFRGEVLDAAFSQVQITQPRTPYHLTNDIRTPESADSVSQEDQEHA